MVEHGERRTLYNDTHSRIAVLESEVRSAIDELKEIRKEQKEQHNCLMAKMDTLSTRIVVLERWRWMIFGGAVVVGYILAHLRIENLF